MYYHTMKPFHENGIFDVAMKSRLALRRKETLIRPAREKLEKALMVVIRKRDDLQVDGFVKKVHPRHDYLSELIFQSLEICIFVDTIIVLYCAIEFAFN